MKHFIPTLAFLLLSSANAQQTEVSSSEVSALQNETFKTPKISSQSSTQNVPNEQVVGQRSDISGVGKGEKSYAQRLDPVNNEKNDKIFTQRPDAINNEKSEKSEFQAFVQYSTGKILNIYGQDFFQAHLPALPLCKTLLFQRITL